MKVSKENKYINFVDTTANEGKRFELKQILIQFLKKRNILNFQFWPDSCSQSFSFQRIHYRETIRHLRNTNGSYEFEKHIYVGNFKIYLIYRGYDDLEINNLILHKILLASSDIDGALHDCEEQKNSSGFL